MFANFMHGPGAGTFGVFGLAASLIMIVFWVLFITLVVVGVRWLVGQPANSPQVTSSTATDGQPESALEMLKRRYAAGEIDAKEFKKIKEDISEPSP